MATFLVYITEWALTLTLLYSLYGLLLKRETFHDINRGILLLILCLSALLPLCPVETEHASTLSQQLDVIETTIYESVSATPTTMSAGSTQATISLSLWPRVLAWVYIAGAIICMGHYLLSLASLARLITRGHRVHTKGMPRGVRVIYSAGLPVSCSWMCWIMTGSMETARRGNPILEHELAHVRLAHSLDMLLCELTARLLWFLPFGWMLRKDLRDVHEFQADRKVLRSGIEEEGYQHLLIRHAVNQQAPSVANSFAHSTIKKRLVMMCRRPSTRKAALKTIYLLPLVLIAVTAFARPTAVEEIRQTLVKEEEAAPLLSPTALTESVKPAKEEPKDPVEEAVTEQTTQPETPTATEETLAVSLPQVEETIQPAQAPTAPPSPAAPAASKPAASPEAVSRVSFAPITQEEFQRLGRDFWIEERDGETYVTFLRSIHGNEDHISLNGRDFKLRDMKSGDTYICRRIIGYDNKQVDVTVRNYPNAVATFTLVFPPLKKSVKKIQLRHPGMRSQKGYKLKEVTIEHHKTIR